MLPLNFCLDIKMPVKRKYHGLIFYLFQETLDDDFLRFLF